MANYIGPFKEVDHYIGENLIVAKYIGETKYFDAYNDISGELPLIFQSRVEHNLKNYRIYGTPEGAGKETENLFDKNITEGIEDKYYINKTTGNKVSNAQYYISAPIAVTSEEKYWWVFRITSGGPNHSVPTVGFFDANDNQIGVASHSDGIKSFTFTTPANCAYVRASVYKYDINEAMLVKASTAPVTYIPYGYQIPILISGEEAQQSNYDLFIGDSKLGEEEYVDFKEQKIYKMIDGTLTPTDPPIALPSISTSQGENTLSSTETLGEITIKGRIRELTYRRVEYLKSTGTQYIQTDIVPLYSYKSELRIKFGSEIHQIENKDYTYIFGISGATALGVYCVQLDGSSGNIIRFRDGYYSTDTSITGINPVVEDTLIMNRPTSFYGNASLTTNAAIEGINPPVEPIVIFGLTGVSAGAKRIWPFKRRDMFLYEFKIYDSNDSLLNDLIPVEREDGELGLLDTITNKFYTNAGTGTFEKGAYIEGDINDTQSNT